jgi:hypothetical protein
VSGVKPAEDSNGLVGLNNNPVVPRQRPSACFTLSSLLSGDFQAEYALIFTPSDH